MDITDLEVLTVLRRVVEVAQPPVGVSTQMPNDPMVLINYVNIAPRLLEIVEAALKRQEIEDHPLLVIDALDERTPEEIKEYRRLVEGDFPGCTCVYPDKCFCPQHPLTEDGLSER